MQRKEEPLFAFLRALEGDFIMFNQTWKYAGAVFALAFMMLIFPAARSLAACTCLSCAGAYKNERPGDAHDISNGLSAPLPEGFLTTEEPTEEATENSDTADVTSDVDDMTQSDAKMARGTKPIKIIFESVVPHGKNNQTQKSVTLYLDARIHQGRPCVVHIFQWSSDASEVRIDHAAECDQDSCILHGFSIFEDLSMLVAFENRQPNAYPLPITINDNDKERKPYE